jgi:hypothetical protein
VRSFLRGIRCHSMRSTTDTGFSLSIANTGEFCRRDHDFDRTVWSRITIVTDGTRCVIPGWFFRPIGPCGDSGLSLSSGICKQFQHNWIHDDRRMADRSFADFDRGLARRSSAEARMTSLAIEE